tara:strand:+ start:1041 stop:2072 length:1032 start_codon:yes stop_codon:yes gene_type:complete
LETVLVTGGSGFIGSHICISLIANKYNVLIIDSLVNSTLDNFKNLKNIIEFKAVDLSEKIKFLKGDLRNKFWLDKVFSDYERKRKPIKFVIHLAGLKSISSSFDYPLEYWDMNVNSSISLFSVMLKYNCLNLVFSSSATVYKPKENYLINEDDTVAPITPYGKTKFAIEEILKDVFICNKGLRVVNLRYFNPVGAHKSGLICENPKDKSNNLFPAIIKVLKKEQVKLKIFGRDWPTKDGTCVRDYIHVMDLADAHIAALNYIISGKPKIINLNIGTGIGTSVLEIIKKFEELNSTTLAYEFVERRVGDQGFLVANNKLALKLLNWKPRRNLIDICRDTISSHF